MSECSSTRAGGAACACTAAASALVRRNDELRIITLNANHALLDDQAAFQEPAQRTRIDEVLEPQHARRQSLRGLASAHAQRALDHDRPLVELRRDEVHGAAVQLDA